NHAVARRGEAVEGPARGDRADHGREGKQPRARDRAAQGPIGDQWVSDPGTLVAILAAAVVALAMISLAALKGWDGWLELRRLELTQGKGAEPKSPAAARLELADLKD